MSATPIFDFEQPPPTPPQTKWIGGVLLGGFVGLLLGLLPSVKLQHLPSFNGLLLLPAYYVAVGMHELGHLLVGSFVGMPPGALVVGGIVIFKSGQRWLVRFDRRRIFGGGMAKALPQKRDIRSTAFGWMIAGGPIASVLFTAACLLAEFKYGDGRWGWIGTLLWIGLLTTILPLIFGSNRSDRARLLMLVRQPDQSRSWMALWALQTEETRGVVPREWDAELVRQMLATDPSAAEYPLVQLLAFYRYTHQHDEQKAIEHLENALARSACIPSVVRQCIFLEAASSSALSRKNIAQARTWLNRAGTVHEPLSTDTVEAAIAICEKRFQDALPFLKSARARMERLKLDSGLARFAKDKLAEYEKHCETALSDLNVSA